MTYASSLRRTAAVGARRPGAGAMVHSLPVPRTSRADRMTNSAWEQTEAPENRPRQSEVMNENPDSRNAGQRGASMRYGQGWRPRSSLHHLAA